MNDFDNAINFFDNLEKKIRNNSGEKANRVSFKTKLAKTDKEARMNARANARLLGQKFDESETPDDELKDVNQETIKTIINRHIENIFGDN